MEGAWPMLCVKEMLIIIFIVVRLFVSQETQSFLCFRCIANSKAFNNVTNLLMAYHATSTILGTREKATNKLDKVTAHHAVLVAWTGSQN